MRSERYLVTGASGFVGRALCAKLLTMGHKLHTIVRSQQPIVDGVDATQIAMLDADTDCSFILSGVKVVFHLASRVHVMRETAPDAALCYRLANVDATLNLARQASQAGVTRFVFVSSAKVHGESTSPNEPWTESSPLQPQDLYAQSKLAAENGLHALALETGMEIVIVRPPLVYGPGAKANFATLVRAVQRELPLPLAAIRNQRSLLALGNLVDFLVVCARAPQAAGQTFLISDGQDLSTPDLVREIAQAAGVTPRLFSVPIRLLTLVGSLAGRQAALERLCGNLQLDISKARHLLSWSPVLSVAEGVSQAVPLRPRK